MHRFISFLKYQLSNICVWLLLGDRPCKMFLKTTTPFLTILITFNMRGQRRYPPPPHLSVFAPLLSRARPEVALNYTQSNHPAGTIRWINVAI